MQEHFRVSYCSQICTLFLALDRVFPRMQTGCLSFRAGEILNSRAAKRVLRPMGFLVFIPSPPPPPPAPRLVMLSHRIWEMKSEYTLMHIYMPAHCFLDMHMLPQVLHPENFLLAKEHTYLRSTQTAYISWICALVKKKEKACSGLGGQSQVLKR